MPDFGTVKIPVDVSIPLPILVSVSSKEIVSLAFKVITDMGLGVTDSDPPVPSTVAANTTRLLKV